MIPDQAQYIEILKTSSFREKYLEQELKIKQLEIELKSMKELNSHLKVFLKKKMSKTEESAKTADDLIGWIQTLFLWILKSLNFGISTISSDSQ